MRRVTMTLLPLPVFLLMATARAQEAPPPERLTLADILDYEKVSDPQISPDGTRVIYTRRWVNKLKDRWDSALWMVNADGSRNRFLVKGNGARWAPDGTRILYLADGEPTGTQLFVRWMDAEGATTQITRVSESPRNPKWSPDDRSIAFTMLIEKKVSWDIDLPKSPKGASWTEAPRIIENTHYRRDRTGFVRSGFIQLFVVPSEGGTPRQLTFGERNVGARPYGFDFGSGIEWTPDGRKIVFDGSRTPDADGRYRESHLFEIDVATRSIRQITRERGPWTSPVLSPDGRTIAFTGYRWTPQSYKAAELHLIGRDGSNQRKVSGDLDRSPRSLRWSADGSGVFFTVRDRGTSNLHFASAEGKVRRVTEGVHVLSMSSMMKAGKAVGVRSASHEPSDIVLFDVSGGGGLKPLTRVNRDILEGKKLGAVEDLWFESGGGARIQGWIVKPPDFDAKKKHPLILHIHGGPHSMYHVGFNFSFQHLASEGYVVLYTNPRGSTGYGTDFGNAIDNAYPGVDYDDLMAGVDAILKRGYVDRERMYVTGVSGGGVLSSWIIGHTDRFAAAAVRAPVTNWISFAGTTDITVWGYFRFRTPFWKDPQLWLRHSPIMHVGNVKTPTLLMTGELDLRTPMGQTEEYYQALRERKVPTAMIRFNGEYHGTGSKPSNFMRTQLYLLNWFGRYGGNRKGE